MLLAQAILVLALQLTMEAARNNDLKSHAERRHLQEEPFEKARRNIFQSISDPFQHEKCFDDLGCYRTSDFYHDTYRPFNLVPKNQSDIKVTFCLYTRQSRQTPYQCPTFMWVNATSPEFQVERTTVFVVHGFLDNGLLPWVMLMKDRFMALDDFNVIVVDWSHGNQLPYNQAAANAWVVAGEIFLLLKYLTKSHNLDTKEIHIVGDNLGAHIAGYVGERLKGELGRITGLDPAGLFFANMPPNTRLDPSDAIYVDVIHTDGKARLSNPLTFGTLQAFGHEDFYPNGGYVQPGCETQLKVASTALLHAVKGNWQKASRGFIACSHFKAVAYFTASLTETNLFVSHECANYEDYLASRCTSCGVQCASMGFFACEDFANHTKARYGMKSRSFYLTTVDASNPHVYHYVIHIKLDDNQSEHNGKIYLGIRGSKSNLEEKMIGKGAITFKANQEYKFLVQTPTSLGKVKQISFHWIASSYLSYIISFYVNVQEIQVEPIDIINEKWRLGNITTFDVRKAVLSGATVMLRIQ